MKNTLATLLCVIGVVCAATPSFASAVAPGKLTTAASSPNAGVADHAAVRYAEAIKPAIAQCIVAGNQDWDECQLATLTAVDGSHYVLSAPLGGGSFGAFMLAVDETGQAWGVKRFVAYDAEAKANWSAYIPTTEDDLRLELGLLQAVTGDAVQVRDVLQADAEIYAIITLTEGDPADLLMQRDNPAIVSDLLRASTHDVALDAARLHALGYVHSDLRAGNFLWTEDGDFMLSDFGIAAELDAAGHAERVSFGLRQHLQQGALVNQGFMSPEAAAGTFGVKADSWSLGVSILASALDQWWMFEDLMQLSVRHEALGEFRDMLRVNTKDGRIDLRRVLDPMVQDGIPVRYWTLHAMFNALRNLDADLCALVLEGMLVPNAQERMDMPSIAAHTAPLYTQAVQARVQAYLAAQAAQRNVARETTLSPLRAVAAYHAWQTQQALQQSAH